MLVPADLPTAQIECAKQILRYPGNSLAFGKVILAHQWQLTLAHLWLFAKEPLRRFSTFE